MSGNALRVDFSGISLSVEGLSESWTERLRGQWTPFLAEEAGPPFLRVRVSESASPVTGEWDPKAMTAHLSADSARYSMPEGSAEIDRSGRSEIRIAAGIDERGYWAMLNLMRASLAWSLPSRPAALLHAAGLIVDGRGYAMVGPEGSGKTTWSELGRRDGALVISDDLALIDGGTSPLTLVGAPFRSTHVGDPPRGRWPLAALLFPRHADEAGWSPVSALVAKARVAANLPFVAEGIERDPRIGVVVERLTGEVPCVDFAFSLDGSFLPALRQWPESRPD